MEVRIAHLYASLMNIYADRGNIIALTQRCRWRGIEAVVGEFGLGEEPVWDEYDFFYLGGGQDREQQLVCRDLAGIGKGLVAAVEEGAALLAICGGYQLLGEYYRTAAGETMEGVGLFAAWTEAGQRRLIGNVVVEAELGSGGVRLKLAGFENHSGKTYLREGAQPLGRVISGFGNNAEDGTEGIIHKNAVGTYMHGPLLPKNAAFNDYLLKKALEWRYGAGVQLPQLDSRFEDAALKAALKKS